MEKIVGGFAFVEGIRWRDGQLWFSDMHGDAVYRLDAVGDLKVVAEVPQKPSGLGWLPDGDLLIVSMADRKLLRQDDDGELSIHADLSALAEKPFNDMVVDGQGRAYVGNFGFENAKGDAVCTSIVARVDPDGSVCQAADDLLFPNGMVITPDGKTLIVAETYGARLTAFDIEGDGSLSGRRLFAQLMDGSVPDGIALDAQGAVWMASPTTMACLRVLPSGEIAQRIDTGRQAITCTLGGEDRKTLYIALSDSTDREECRASMSAEIVSVRVDVPGAGLP